jgi:alpha-L-arabinofuranosidase
VDYISLHHYGGSMDTPKEIHDASKLEHEVHVLDAVITSVAGKNEKKERVKIAADEWNIWFRSWFKRGDDHKLEEIYNLRDALWAASALNIFHRNCRTVQMADLAQLVNVIAPILANPTGIVLQTIYFPLQLYAQHSGNVALDTFVRSDAFPDMPDTPYLDVSATTNDNAEKLTLSVVNRHPTSDITAEISIEGFKLQSAGDLYEVNGPSLDSTNTFAEPKNVSVKRSSFTGAGPAFHQTFPAHSLTVLTLHS